MDINTFVNFHVKDDEELSIKRIPYRTSIGYGVCINKFNQKTANWDRVSEYIENTSIEKSLSELDESLKKIDFRTKKSTKNTKKI